MPIFAVGMLGAPELLIGLVIVLVLFGAGKLPQVFSAFGKGLKSFRDAQREVEPGPSIDVTGGQRELPHTGPEDVQVIREPEVEHVRD